MRKFTLLVFLLTVSLGYSQNTDCTGTSTDAVQGTFTYDYDFVTNGTDVDLLLKL